MKNTILERFYSYVKIDTQSDEESLTFPSTSTQIEFQKSLAEELKSVGMAEVELDENGYLTATLPANTEGNDLPVIGFISHVDTSPDYCGKNIKPQLHENYDGGEIVLNKKDDIILSPKVFSVLNRYIGDDIITSDGSTLLGADDKAGIAEIVTAMEYLVNHPEIKHGKLRIAFTPDEEIGKGADKFDVEKFGADFAYTMDGGECGELEYENFNAAGAKITVNGVNVHPGTAKNEMKNSVLIAMELNSMLPVHEVPEHTEGYEGFYHLNSMQGDVSQTVMKYIIRDHDEEKFNQKKSLMIKIVDHINLKYGKNTANLTLVDQYYNMKKKIEPVMHVVDLARKAMVDIGVKPIVKPIRGGTDGARLSFMGLPAPNIFAGGHNFHGRYEFIPLQSMIKSVNTIIKIAETAAEK